MTQTGSTGLISAANTAAPRAVCKDDGDFRAILQAFHRTRRDQRRRGLVRMASGPLSRAKER
jgi:hypothetical protein